VYVTILRKVDEIDGPVAFIIDAEGIYRSRAWWTNVEKGGEKGNKIARAKRTEVNNGGGGVVGALKARSSLEGISFKSSRYGDRRNWEPPKIRSS